MTVDGLAGDLPVPRPMSAVALDQAGREPAAPSVATILTGCDRILAEVGRRRHVFGWLRPPDAGVEEWLAVDAYYPRNRLVVICSSQPAPHDDLCAKLVPEHGLRLLALSPARIPSDPVAARPELERMIAKLGPDPTHRLEPARPERSVAVALASRALASLSAPTAAPDSSRDVDPSRETAAERAARFVAARKVSPSRRLATESAGSLSAGRNGGLGSGGPPGSPGAAGRSGGAGTPGRTGGFSQGGRATAPARLAARPRAHSRSPARRRAARTRSHAGGEREKLGVLVGLALAFVLGAEVYIGVALVALDAGQLLFALAIVLDACSRVLGVVAAERSGRKDWAWACVIAGSPAVAIFALFQRSGRVSIEPAPLAGLISLLVGLLAAIAVLGAMLGS